MFSWWNEGTLTPGYFDDPVMGEADFIGANPSLKMIPPDHVWRWDPVGVEHTDPTKVMGALEIAHAAGFITDRDIQEERFNRSVEDWQDDLREQQEFRAEVGMEVNPMPSMPVAPDDSENADEA